jgi:hypothetical protein
VIKGKYYNERRCTNMGGSKHTKNPNEKNGFL